MKIPALASLLLLLAVISHNAQVSDARQRASFNHSWLFQRDDPAGYDGQLGYDKTKPGLLATGQKYLAADQTPQTLTIGSDIPYTQPAFNDSAWRKLDLPHDWAIEGDFQQALPGETGKRPFAGVGWYRKHFSVPAADKGRQIHIDFDGAMAYPTVWVNGRFVGGWAYGYASFRLDLTPFINFGGENVIAVRLQNLPESSRWYPGSGIYRNVWLVETDPVHVAQWGTNVSTEFPGRDLDVAIVNVRTTVENSTVGETAVNVKTSVYGPAGQVISVAGSETKIGSTAQAKVDAVLTVPKPKLWRIETPVLYRVVVEVRRNGKVVDVYETPFGIREIKFDAQQGFLLNGNHVYLKGVCNHHDLGALGSALNVRALERQLEIMKEMGVNAIRTSHNPPAPELLDLADRMGFVVMDEGFDAWLSAKKPNDYHLLFADWHEIDWRSQIRRDRNHPSVILWSIGNEIREQGSPEGHKVAADLTRIAHEEDPTRPVTAGANNANAGYNGFQKTVDVFGYNYRWREYEKFRQTNPDLPLIASETSSAVSSRGEYYFPVVADKAKGRKDFQMSSYDLYAPSWAWPPDTEFEADDKFKFVGGEFVWTGLDYLGEPTPYGSDSKTLLEFSDPARQAAAEAELKQRGAITTPSRSSYFGIVDLAGFKKDRFYIYQARWRPDLPMAHILPHWNWPERVGQVTPVHVYTSGDEAELFLNGRSLGRKKRGQFEYRTRWDDVKYEPGELRVVAYKNGKRWAEEVVRTTGSAAQLKMSPDRSGIAADGEDLSFITIKIADSRGAVVPRSNNRLKLSISGPGEIIAMDNGDATDLESFQSMDRRAYNGLALVVVRARRGQKGAIRVRAESNGLSGTELVIRAR